VTISDTKRKPSSDLSSVTNRRKNIPHFYKSRSSLYT